jgi:hypothetical protein
MLFATTVPSLIACCAVGGYGFPVFGSVINAQSTYGIVPKKGLTSRMIGLENDRHCWRGVMDGDGCINVRNGKEGDKIILTGGKPLLCQFKMFVVKYIPGAVIRISQEGKYWRLYVYSNTAKALAKLLYDNCQIALDRKLAKARQMFSGAHEEPEEVIAGDSIINYIDYRYRHVTTCIPLAITSLI